MNAKEINRESGRVFGALLPPSWAQRSQEDQEDYGIDFEIELMTAEDKATGIIFKVQLKGTSISKINETGELVYSDASVSRFGYYLLNLKIPFIFVVCDVATGFCYWVKVQGNRQMERDHSEAAEKGQKTFTIRIPISQQLQKTQDSAGRVVDAVAESLDSITLKSLQSLTPDSVRLSVGHVSDLEQTEKQFRLFAGVAANETIRKLLSEGDTDSACKKAQSLFESSSESPEIRILGGWNLAHCINVYLRRSKVPGGAFEAAQYKLGIASQMINIARNKQCEVRLKRYSRIYTRAARMQVNSRVAMALVTSEKTQAQQGDTIAGPITTIKRMEVTAQVTRDFLRLRDSLIRLGRDGFYSVLPYALSEITESVFSFVAALQIMGSKDLADAYVDALFDFLPFCFSIVRKLEICSDIEDILSALGLRFIGLANPSDPESMLTLLRRFEDCLAKEPKIECGETVISMLRAQVAEHRESSKEKVEPSMDEIRSYYAERASELGINLSDPNDDIAEIVRIGLDDLDPTRVSKDCRHIHVMPTTHGIPAEMLGLPTAGSKRVVCLKHGHSTQHLKLDTAYNFFKQLWPLDQNEVRCDNCPDKAPHPEGWVWSSEWEKEQYARYLKLTKQDNSEQEGETENK